jgi:hypothetical protein
VQFKAGSGTEKLIFSQTLPSAAPVAAPPPPPPCQPGRKPASERRYTHLMAEGGSWTKKRRIRSQLGPLPPPATAVGDAAAVAAKITSQAYFSVML